MNIEHLITPYKYGRPVLTGSGVEGTFNSRAVDCPTVFRHNGKYYIMYIGFDGTGYQTALATSDNLTDWKHEAVILPRGSKRGWDSVGMGGTALLMENDLFEERTLKKYDGKYWLMYHAYPGEGYEEGAAEIGLAWTEDENLLDWHFHGDPVFSWRDGADWEKGGLYKCFLLEHEGRFYIFYNAKNVTAGNWIEQTGMAISDDMIHWTRPYDHPVLPVEEGAWDSKFASDPQVFWDSRENQWVMFYFGLGNLSACEGLAVSSDLHHWKKFPAPILTIGKPGELDCTYAHKPGMIWTQGLLYHFYCACRPSMEDDPCTNGGEFRCITVARDFTWKQLWPCTPDID